MFKRNFTIKSLIIVLLIVMAASCRLPNGDVVFGFDFGHGWEAGFADYPVGQEADYQLASEYTQLPSPLQDSYGMNVSGINHSDDLFMFIKKRFTGFEPNTQYQLRFEITFATNAPSGCSGVGGPPGEGVAVKAGATTAEPLPYDDGSGFYLMNIDKGNQGTGGSDAIVMGDFANSKKCEDGDFSYELKTLRNVTGSFTVSTESDGGLWLLFGTDSGFEGATSIYYVGGNLVATKL